MSRAPLGLSAVLYRWCPECQAAPRAYMCPYCRTERCTGCEDPCPCADDDEEDGVWPDVAGDEDEDQEDAEDESPGADSPPAEAGRDPRR
jgi:hypothetical protein